MRLIGHLDNRKDSATFGGYLYSLSIGNQMEEEPDGRWAVWIQDDDHVQRAVQEFERFRADPTNPAFAEGAKRGTAKIREEEQQDKQSRYRAKDVRTSWGTTASGDFGFLTVGLVIISIGAFLVGDLKLVPDLQNFYQLLWFDWPHIMQGQVWRILTPIFVHYGLIHIAFNMMWLKGLGSEIELEEGTLTLAAMTLLFGIVGNVIQYVMTGPGFGGMSGVVYGLFGYIWIRSKYDPNVRYGIDSTTTAMMIGWFFFGFIGLLPIANGAHAGGFICGIMWAAVRVRRIPFTKIRF